MSDRKPLYKGDKIQISNDWYVVNKLLARGGTSLIYEAERVYCDNVNSHNLAVRKKVLMKELAPLGVPFERNGNGTMLINPDRMTFMKALFKQEIQNIAYIQNQNHQSNRIPDMDAYGEYNNTIYIAMNYIKGRLLSDYIYQEDYDSKTMQDIFWQLVSIVESLHKLEKPFYHLDLKPSNFIIDDLNCIYLFDFGSCALKDSRLIYAYSEGYSAPEVMFNKVDAIDERADYYSLGAILYEMATKRKPTLEWVLFDRSFGIDVYDEVSELILGLMSEKVENRASAFLQGCKSA